MTDILEQFLADLYRREEYAEYLPTNEGEIE
jgi:hypothetical protein